MRIKQILTAIFLLLGFSNIDCKDWKDTKYINVVHNIKVNNSLNYNHLFLDSIIKDMHLIPLKCNGQVTLKEIDKIIVYESKFYILDRFQGQGVFVFDSAGNFLLRVGSIGKMKGQYMYPLDILIDSSKKELMILNSDFGAINVYDVNTGNFRYSLNNPNSASRFSKITGGEWWLSGGDSKFNLTLTSSKLSKEIEFLPKKNGMPKMAYESFLHIGDSLNLFVCNYTDTVYRFIGNKVYPYVWLNFGDSGVTYEQAKSIKKFEDITKKFPEKKIFYRYYFQNNTHIYFTYIKDRKLNGVIYDINKKTSIAFPCESVTDNSLFNNNFPVIVSTDNNGNFIAISDSYLLNIALKEGKKSTELLSNKRILDTLKINDIANCSNPVLFIFKFK